MDAFNYSIDPSLYKKRQPILYGWLVVNVQYSPLILIHQAIETLANVAELLQAVNSEGVLEVVPGGVKGQLRQFLPDS